MKEVVALAPGTRVSVGPGISLHGTVIAVTVREVGVTGYEVAWWDGNSRTCAWLEPSEVTVADEQTKPLQIGFGVVE